MGKIYQPQLDYFGNFLNHQQYLSFREGTIHLPFWREIPFEASFFYGSIQRSKSEKRPESYRLGR